MENIGWVIAQSCLFGFVIATIFCFVVALKHKTVKIAKHANKYFNEELSYFTKRHDYFVGSSISKIPHNNK